MDCKLRAKNCGGCPMLGMDYAAQLKQKEETVKKLLGRFGPVEHIRGMETPYHYRNKVISTFTTGWGGKLTSGIYAANSHKVLPVESCLLQDEVLDKTMLAVRAAAGPCHYQPFNEDKGTGLLRHCLLRRGVMTGQVMVVLVTAQPVLPGAKNFVKALLTEAGKQGVAITTIVQNVNDRKTSVVLGDMEKVLYGKGFILDTLCGKTYAISPRSFYQINHTQTEVLYGLAVDAAHLTGKEVVLDAYCGIGTIGLTAADHAKQVVGVEVNREAVHDAIGNAKHNGVKNARFFAADATRWIGEAAAAGERADVIFIKMLREAARSDQPEDKLLLWLSRPSGTFCFRERDVLLKDTQAYNTWKFCGEQTHDRILAYAVELTGAANGTVQGNLYELDYQQHFQHIREVALPVGANRLIYESGMREIGPKKHFDSRPDKYFGEFVRYEMQPRDPELLQAAIRQEQRSREPARPGDFKEHLAALHTGLIEAEAQRIAADMKRLAAPNSPDKNHFMVEVSPYFTKLASSRDTDQLLAMLPYKSLHLSSVKDRFGIYALVGKNENRDKGICKPRTSVRKQLSETKQAASPKKAAARSKQHEMEV